MMKKIIPILIVLIISVSCLSLVSADNGTDNETIETNEIEDLANFITVNSINGHEIAFSDGFMGFCLDATKTVDSTDKFTSQSTTSNENDVKLAIIECYKQNKENDIGNVIQKVLAKDSGDSVAENVLGSSEQVGDHVVVNISNSTEATFDFELLKSSQDGKPDCIAYKVSLQTIIPEDTVSDNGTDNATDEVIQNDTDKNTTPEEVIPNETDDANKTTPQSDDKQTSETNKTITNKTNIVIINETNTTIIKKNNTKVITKNDTPQNATLQHTIMKAAGNPIVLLAIVVIIIAVVAVVMRRR